MGIDWFGMVFGLGLAVSFGYWCTDFLQVQRVIVAKNLRAAQNGTIIGAVLKMCVPLIVTIPGLLGLAVLMNHDGLATGAGGRKRSSGEYHPPHFQRRSAAVDGPVPRPRPARPGGDGDDRRLHVGHGGQCQRLRHRLDLRRLSAAAAPPNASDRHYLLMGRWASLLGVLISIGTAYALFYFSNILEFLQVLVFFFIVPLFGVVILGMLWKRATPAGGFWGFLTAIIVSMCMWGYVHTFPDGYYAHPDVILGEGTVVNVEMGTGSASDEIVKVTVESGTVQAANVPILIKGQPFTSGTMKLAAGDVSLPVSRPYEGKENAGPRAGQKVIAAATKEKENFLAEGVPVVLKAGVMVEATGVRYFYPAGFNPEHTQYIARSKLAKPMAVNMYSAFWTLCVSLLVTVAVSLFTRPKTDAELKNLVMGLTPLPDEGPCPWYQRPLLWATLVLVALVAINYLYF